MCYNYFFSSDVILVNKKNKILQSTGYNKDWIYLFLNIQFDQIISNRISHTRYDIRHGRFIATKYPWHVDIYTIMTNFLIPCSNSLDKGEVFFMSQLCIKIIQPSIQIQKNYYTLLPNMQGFQIFKQPKYWTQLLLFIPTT